MRWTTAIFGFCLGAALTCLCWWSAGVGLGLFFGAAAVMAILAGPLVLADKDHSSRALAWAAAVDGAGIVLLVAAFISTITLWQWLECYLVLGAFAVALAGLAVAAGRLMRSRIAGAVVSIVVGCAWLAWPMALAPQTEAGLARRVAQALLVVHPWMAMNRPLLGWGTWPTAPLAYTYTRLHDLGEVIPPSIMPAVLWHLTAGVVLLFLATWRKALKRP